GQRAVVDVAGRGDVDGRGEAEPGVLEGELLQVAVTGPDVGAHGARRVSGGDAGTEVMGDLVQPRRTEIHDGGAGIPVQAGAGAGRETVEDGVADDGVGDLDAVAARGSHQPGADDRLEIGEHAQG